ncbi:Ectoine hydrolase [Arthrobacter sp. Bi83]|uniref:M24 family metallopeptidase n=1 Tax=Arthrobacter sp. Bi83 TaxID=2822353 RepID=UPI001D28D43C|nr:Xaa-Pro peptidase family protein [Arthrobacter sp. Bi83]CAH0218266.1 Ectoine hydrolase [Arthrobacter sp. Bi83]
MWFDAEEYVARLEKARKYMAERDLDYLLVFEPETVTYLTGFYTLGYSTSFQFALIPSSGSPLTVLRKAEEHHFLTTAAWPENCMLWYDGEEPAAVVLRVLREASVKGRVGFDGGSWRAPFSVIESVRTQSALDLLDLGLELERLRFIKSPAELDYLRNAGQAVGLMHAAGIDVIRPGATERDIVIATSAAAVRGGSDYAEPGPIASGDRAYHIHSAFDDRTIADGDLVFLEMTAHKKNYHARSMRTVFVGTPEQRMVDTYRRFVEIQDEALATIKAGVHCSTPDRMIREGILGTDWVESYPNKTFYGIGMILWPNTYEKLEVTHNADFNFEAGMTFHAYISAHGLNISETIAVTEDGVERLTTFARELFVK